MVVNPILFSWVFPPINNFYRDFYVIIDDFQKQTLQEDRSFNTA